MFDLQRAQNVIVERYFRLLRGYHQPDLLQRFMQRWTDLLSMYSTQSKFISFDPPIPLLHRLEPLTSSRRVGGPVSQHPRSSRSETHYCFPSVPFSNQYTSHTECSRYGMEMMSLYLKLTGIRTIGFFKVSPTTQHQKIIPELQQSFPHLRIYGSSAFNNFRTVCNREATTTVSGGSKCQ
ncbi:uncharacterized protein NPIL_189901 [Nephila pilipes]|uniref:Uncharacterized protein n=1 Tax=Nephila pilipes TaxID=299642 RepID=A0A8X6Q9F2_NEPPI|nr:uncharacterized protein NPIL_189901 [Nephila pilipes]